MDLIVINQVLENLQKCNRIEKSLDIINKAYKSGEISDDLLEKAKYIRREGSPGHYTYIYAETDSKGSSNNEHESLNKLIGKRFSINGENFHVKGFEDIGGGKFHVVTEEGKKFSYNILKDKKTEFHEATKEKKEKTGSGLISKNDYNKQLKGAMNDAKSTGNEDDTHDIAENLYHDKDIVERVMKDNPGIRTKSGLIQRIQWDLESFL